MSVEFITILVLTVLLMVSLGVCFLFLTRFNKNKSSSAVLNDPLSHQISAVRSDLEKVSALVRTLEKDRDTQFGQISSQLKATTEQTIALNSTTNALREALANSRARGQWGERMAEDILRVIGFTEGVNYVKQSSMPGGSSRPDFTFMLPNYLKLNMDVKFPLDNYLKAINSESPEDKNRNCNAFLRDVRDRLNEITTRDYIDAQQSTVGCVLLFIPNEQIFQFIQENDLKIMDEALRKHVILCSPMTLFAILVVIRQAVDNFAINQTSDQIISELGLFTQQWELFINKLEDVGKRLDAAQTSYETLTTTRKRAMERSLSRIDALRGLRELPPAGNSTESASSIESENITPSIS